MSTNLIESKPAKSFLGEKKKPTQSKALPSVFKSKPQKGFIAKAPATRLERRKATRLELLKKYRISL
jgi:hypothetical protein